MLLDVRPDHFRVGREILRRLVPDREVWAFGSRAKWTARDTSDLDLCIVGDMPLGFKRLGQLRDAFSESSLPYKVDVVDWATTSESFRKIIERDKVVVQRAGPSSGMAASEWAPIRLGDVCMKIGSGATPRGGNDVYLQDGPYALIRSQNVYNDGFHHDGLAFIDEKHAAELENVKVLDGDVLLNITGDSVARACQVDPGVLPARVNQHVAIIRPDPGKLAPRFLRYVLVSHEMQTKLLSWAGSGGTRNALTKGMIESFDVLAPTDVAEQRAIAHILGTLDDKIELNRRMNETLEAMARALFKS
ncbi:MAG: restriction endonuclease subunit S, partial [Gammaproteobacteria bacterium]